MRAKTVRAGWALAAATGMLGVVGGGDSALAANTDGQWQVNAGGLWSSTANWLDGKVADGIGYTADFNHVNITADSTANLDSARTIGNLIFGDTAPSNGWILSNNGNAANVLTLAIGSGSPTITVNSTGSGKNVLVDAVLSGTKGLTKLGTGTLSLRAVNTYTGTTTVNAGTLQLDFTALSGTSTVLNTSSPLALGGGTLSIKGRASGATSHTFTNGTKFGPGASAIRVDPNGGTVYVALKLLDRSAGSTLDFTLPAGTTVTTTSTTFSNGGYVLVSAGSAGVAYATVNGADWATNYKGAIGTLGSYQTDYTATASNIDVVNNPSPPAVFGVNTLRFNTAQTTLTLNGTGPSTIHTGGILVTSATSGANAATIASGGVNAALRSGGGKELVIINNGALDVGAPIVNSSLGISILTLAGTGTTKLSATNTYTGATLVTAGTLLVDGSLASGSAVTVNSGATLGGIGTVLGSVTVAGTIAPGSGTTTSKLTTGAETWSATGAYSVDLNNAAGTAGSASGWDSLVMSSLTQADGFKVNLLSSAAPANFNATGIYEWVIAEVAAGAFNTGLLTLDTTGFKGQVSGLFSLDTTTRTGGGQNLVLKYTYSAVPEATTVLLAMVGLTPVLLQRRRGA